MKSLECFGAAGEVTGSAHLLTSNNNRKYLIDCGMFQGREDLVRLQNETLDYHPRELSAVLLTHAHFDHIGRIPLLTKKGYKGNYYMTAPTADLTRLILKDAVRIFQSKIGTPLYKTEDVNKAMKQVIVIPYNQPFDTGDFSVEFNNAGHILGSATIAMKEKGPRGGQKIVFSGDLGSGRDYMVDKTDTIKDADIVVTETTYGDKDHRNEDPKDILRYEINQIERAKKGTLLIPAFSVHRSQAILLLLKELKETGKVDKNTLVFFDSPMAQVTTDIYRQYLNSKEFFKADIREQREDPFKFEGLINVNSGIESRKLINIKRPKVIIAGAGMMTGGRVLTHAVDYLPEDYCRVLFVGFQGEETLGREILEGAKDVCINDISIPVRANINSTGALSSHIDQSRLLDWVGGSLKGVKKVCLVHGEQIQRESFAEKLQYLGIYNIELPERNQPIALN